MTRSSNLVFLLLILTVFIAVISSTTLTYSLDHPILKEKSNFHTGPGSHARTGHSDHIVRVSRASPHTKHQVILMPTQQHLHELETILYDVSTPQHPNYGKFWTKQDIVSYTRSPESIAYLKEFLAFHHITIIHESLHEEYITAEASIAQWESIFHTEFYTFYMKQQGSMVTRCLEYSLPQELHAHIMAVFNTVQFPVISHFQQHRHKTSIPLAGGGSPMTIDTQFPGYVTPYVITSTYDVDITLGNDLVSQGLYESSNQTMSPTDLTKFQKVFNLLIQNISGDTGHVANNACFYDENDCAEANLDVQYIMGIGQNIPTYYDYDNSPDDDFLLMWITEIADSPNPHTVYSISYGAYESDFPKSYIDAFDTEVMKLGMMGTSVLAASGDDGAPGFYARGNSSACSYGPMYPAASPYVTAVGGTTGPQLDKPEVACESNVAADVLITSGGGFSNYYTAPSYQQILVNNYFNSILGTDREPAAGYNRGGRGYPDVALLAHNYFVVLNDTATSLDGTSASCPVFAAMINLINSEPKAAGLPTLGFLNPALYSKYMYFSRDVYIGSNLCTALSYNYATQQYERTCCAQGYYTELGWDPVTGLGSVDFSALNDALGVTVITGSADGDDDALSGGSIAGIVFGTFVGLLLFGVVYLFYFKGFTLTLTKNQAMHHREGESFDDSNL